MVELKDMCRFLGIEDRQVTPAMRVELLGVAPAKVVELIRQRFPILIGYEGQSPDEYTQFLHGTMDVAADVPLPEGKGPIGDPWTLGRLQKVLEQCVKHEMPDNGSD